jgi:hypothetical protein
MSFYFPEGSAIYFSSTLASAKTISALTNANPAVATSTSHGYSDNDELLYEGGWEDYDESVFLADQSDANTFSLLGMNATNTTFYPAGSGTGTVKKISSWVQIPQVLTVNSQGGDARFTNVQLLSKRNAINVPTGFNATTITLGLAHDPADANYQTMLDVSRAGTKVAIKMTIGGGALLYGYGYLSVSEMPSLNVNQVNTVQAALSLLGRPVSYEL